MDRTVLLSTLALLFATCSAGNGYSYIRPAIERGSVGPVVGKDGSTKSVYFFADPDDHGRAQKQRPVTYNQVTPQQRPITYTQVAPQQQAVTYNQVAPQQHTVTYSQVAPQQQAVTYTQVAPQQRPVTFSQVAPQQRPVIYSNAAPQQGSVSYTQKVVTQQRPITYSQVITQQRPTTYTQVAPQQRPIAYTQGAPQQPTIIYNQAAPQPQPITYNQVAPQQQPIAYNPVAPQPQPITYNQVAPQQQQQVTYNQIAPQQLPFTANQVAAPVKQNLQVIFVKTPGYEAYTNALLKMAKEAIQTQTIVYVLSKEPDVEELTRRFKEIQATARKMPEVRFIKYKTDDEAVQAQKDIQAQYENLPGPSKVIGTPIGSSEISNEIQTGSTSPNYGATNTEDDLLPENRPPFLPTGVDVVPGSSYLPPLQKTN